MTTTQPPKKLIPGTEEGNRAIQLRSRIGVCYMGARNLDSMLHYPTNDYHPYRTLRLPDHHGDSKELVLDSY